METKRLIIAIALSIVVITIYQYFFMPKPQPRTQQPGVEGTQIPGETAGEQTAGQITPATPTGETGQKTTDSTLDPSDLFSKKEPAPVETESFEAVNEDIKGTSVQETVVETDLYTATFTNEGAALKSFVLKNYKDDEKLPLDLVSNKTEKLPLYPFHFSPFEGNETLLMLNGEKFVYDGLASVMASGKQPSEIVFKYKDVAKNISVFKKFIFTNGSYIVGLDYEVIKDGKEMDAPFVFGPDLENNVSSARAIQMGLKIRCYDGEDSKDQEFLKVGTEPKRDNINIEGGDGTLGSNFIWAAYERAYFAAIFKTSPRNSIVRYSVIKKKLDLPSADTKKDDVKKTELYSYIIVTNPQLVYLGPKDEDLLEEVEGVLTDANEVIEYGMLGTIAKILLKGINFVHGFIPNYGWAIIVFTIFLKIILFPLTYASSVSMAKMQTLQPKIKAIKKKYKNARDPEQRRKMNEETMQLYKREKVNPASGCLPMLLQMPILFGFFNLLRTCINVRHEPWIFWIQDLSLKDPIYLLPILMGITQLIVQMMSPSGAEGSQKKMMYIMPVVITFFVMSLPSGLTLYWFASNVLQIGQQYIINKKIFSEKKEEDKQRKAQKRKKGGKS